MDDSYIYEPKCFAFFVDRFHFVIFIIIIFILNFNTFITARHFKTKRSKINQNKHLSFSHKFTKTQLNKNRFPLLLWFAIFQSKQNNKTNKNPLKIQNISKTIE